MKLWTIGSHDHFINYKRGSTENTVLLSRLLHQATLIHPLPYQSRQVICRNMILENTVESSTQLYLNTASILIGNGSRKNTESPSLSKDADALSPLINLSEGIKYRTSHFFSPYETSVILDSVSKQKSCRLRC